ncbi:MAG: right-handed parallel beta-helix repeat-containing protein [Eubacterium sp.]
MKKSLSFLLSVIIVISSCLCFTANAFATDYKEIKVSIANGSDAKEAVQEALNVNRYDSSQPIKVIIPAGSYKLSDHFIIYSNTYLECTGATFTKTYNSGTMLAIGLTTTPATGDSYYHDITINGGTFDADGKSGKKTGSILKFSHAGNVTISNVSFKNCCNAHHIGFAGCSNVLITGCTFEGHYSTSSNADNNMEAVQLDILEKSHFPDQASASYDGTMSSNVTVTGCTFNNVNRGIGSHSAFSGKYIDNVTITDNTFTNVTGYAVITSNYRNVNISSNVMTNCGSGIYYRSTIPEYANLYATGNTPQTDPGSIITNNTISISDMGDKNYTQFPYGVRVYGESLNEDVKINGGTLKAGDYRVQNVTVSNNSITANCCANGIWFVGANNNSATGNTVTYTTGKSSSKKCFPIRVESAQNIDVSNNTFKANSVSYVENGIITDKSKNINISYNNVSGAMKNGINISTKSQAVLTGNTVTNNKENGILCYDNSKITTNGNIVKNNKKHGIFIVNSATASSLNNDTVQSNKKYGIALQNSTAKLKNEKALKNSQYGIYLTQKSSASMNNCTASSNSKEGIYVTQNSKATISSGTVASNKGNGIYFTNNAKGSVKNTKVQKNSKKGIYLTKKVGKITLSGIKYSGNKGGKLQK